MTFPHSDAAVGEILSRSFYARSVHDVARDLLGMIVVRAWPDERGPRRLAGRIVEVEAYDGPRDRASHASKGRTRRTEVMFGPAGHAYVYLVYGMHCCLNVVTGQRQPFRELSRSANGPQSTVLFSLDARNRWRHARQIGFF